MKTVLITDHDESFLLTLRYSLKVSNPGLHIVATPTMLEASQALVKETVDLVVVGFDLSGDEGRLFLDFIRSKDREIPVIALLSDENKHLADAYQKKGVTHTALISSDPDVLAETILNKLAISSKGFIQGFTPSSLLQMLNMEKKSCTLQLDFGGQTGRLFLYHGDLVDAELGEVRGRDAAVRILGWDDARIEIDDKYTRRRTIQAPLMDILLEASRTVDEGRQQVRSSDRSLLENAIRLAEGLHFSESQKVLARLLKANPKNGPAWVWYSRTALNPATIEKALKNARLVAADDDFTAQETKRFESAPKDLKPGEIRRCPFCWTPTAAKALECPFCRSHFFVTRKALYAGGEGPDRAVLQEALQRYKTVINIETNVSAHYYLGMACLNLKQWESALGHLESAARLAKDKPFYADQLQILTNWLAASTSALTENSANKAAAPAEGKPEPTGDRGKKILVVEDSSTTRKLIVVTLRQHGYEVSEAADGLEALSLLDSDMPNLILLDVILPKMDGNKILSIIKGNPQYRQIPVIMLTSRDSFMAKVKSRLAGSAGYLTKPFKTNQLIEMIQKHLGQSDAASAG